MGKHKHTDRKSERTGQNAPQLCRLNIPSDMRNHGTRLLDQQMWCWGQDVTRAEGNLLLTCGFVRHRPPENVKASTAYFLRTGRGCQVILWGYGLYYCDPDFGGLFMSRRDFKPYLATCNQLAETWLKEPDYYAPTTASETQQLRYLFACSLRWIADYEQQVTALAGVAHRHHTLACWHKKAVIQPDQLVAAWTQLSDRALTLPILDPSA